MSEVNYLDSFTKWKEKKARINSVNLNKKIKYMIKKMNLDNERFTYANLRIMEIKRKLLDINKEIKPNDIEVINIALVRFSIICDTHANNELERHLIIEDMLDSKSDFIYYVNDLIKQTSDTNHSLNRYIEKQLSQESK